MDFLELFRSVEVVWALWFSSLILLGLLSRHLFRRVGRVDYRAVLARLHPWRLHRDIRGAAYSLSFIMVLPFLIFLIAMIIETTFMLVAKIGTMQAAFAAARTASVWTTRDTGFRSADDDFKLASSKAKQAAITTMVPYASGYTDSTDHQANAEKYVKIYDLLDTDKPKRPLSREYIMKKYQYAAKSVDVELDYAPTSKKANWEKYVQAEVSYVYPFKIMPLGHRLGGTKQPDGTYVYKISSTAKMNNECPRNNSGEIRIKLYD